MEDYATPLAHHDRRPWNYSQDGSMALSEELIPGAGECGCRGHRNAHAQLHRALRAEGVDRSHRSRPPDVQHDARQEKSPRCATVRSLSRCPRADRFSGERARQPDFLTPYLKAVLGIIGLHDLTFFSVQGTGSGPDAVAEARARTDQALQEHFSAFAVQTHHRRAS